MAYKKVQGLQSRAQPASCADVLANLLAKSLETIKQGPAASRVSTEHCGGSESLYCCGLRRADIAVFLKGKTESGVKKATSPPGCWLLSEVG